MSFTNGNIVDQRLVELIRGTSRILIFTGAGISTTSGIADYRGPQGVWKRRRPVYYQDFMSSEEARSEYWDFYLEGWESFKKARPNATHAACVRLDRAGKLEMVVTQNIDGLHAMAGLSADRLVEVHGTNRVVECQTCHLQSEPESCINYFRQHRKAPVCDCGGLLKPATISFGQSLKEQDMHRAAVAAASADLVISLGSTLSVYPAASVPLTAAQRGVPYVIINRGPTEHDAHHTVHLRLEGDVVDMFPPAVEAACP